MSAEKLKAVLILGPELRDTYDYLASLYNKSGYLVLGSGLDSFPGNEMAQLKGRIDQNTRIDINLHGHFFETKHYLKFTNKDWYSTYELFDWLKQLSDNTPLQIHFWSCYGGAANIDVRSLAEGSVLINHIPSQYSILYSPAVYTIKQNLIKLQQPGRRAFSAIENFIDNLSHEMSQTASISTYIHKTTYELTLAPKLSEVIANPYKVIEEEAIKVTGFAKMIDELMSTTDQKTYSNFKTDGIIEKFSSGQEKRELQEGVFLHACNTRNIEEITQVLRSTSEDLIKELLELNTFDIMPLRVAVEDGYLELVKVLVEHNADVNQVDKKTGVTPLLLAAGKGYIEIVKFLAEHNADVNKAAYDSTTPLWKAAAHGYVAVVKILMEHNADVNKIAIYGSTALYVATQEGHTDVIQLLLEYQAHVNKPSNYDMTPLHVAINKGYFKIVEILVEAKADMHMKDHFGNTPLELARIRNYQEIVKLLEDAIEAEQKASTITDHYANELIGEYRDHEANQIYQDEL